MAILTKGTEMWLVKAGSSGYEVIKIGCPTGISGLGGSRTQIPTTCLDSEEQEFLGGLASSGPLTVNLDFDPEKISHRELFEMSNGQELVKWAIGFSDGTDSPTTDSSGIVLPATRTFVYFDGYIADFPFDIALDSVVKSAMQVQRSGPRAISYKV